MTRKLYQRKRNSRRTHKPKNSAKANKPKSHRGSAAARRSGKRSPATTPRALARLSGARQDGLPAKFKPQLATLADKVPAGDNWLHELKFDGYRMLAFVDRGTVRLMSRNGKDWTHRFGRIAAALGSLPVHSAILDGEIVSLNDEGLSDFQELQNLLKRGNDAALVYYLFDAPYLNGFDLTQTPLVERKKVLADLLLPHAPQSDGILRYSEHIPGQGEDVFAHACRYAMEGIVSKRADSTYQQFRSPAWVKVKCVKRQELVIGGFTKPSGSRVGFGALLVGYYDDGKLRYAGRVGTGFTHDSLRQIHSKLKKRRTDSPPFVNPPRGSMARGVTWVRPELVGEVEFTEWTDDGILRHPSFQGLRDDKPPGQIVREVAKPISIASGAGIASPRVAGTGKRQPPTRRREFEMTTSRFER